MSTAEAVNVMHAAALEAAYLDNGKLSAAHVARQLQGVVLKDAPEDGKRLRAYVDHIVKERAGRSGAWKDFYQAARALKLS
jgi:translation elongation factor EF-Ts